MTADALQMPVEAVSLTAALAVGIVIGLERGWRDRDVADGGRVAGLRTFALAGLLGGVFALGGPWLLGAGALAVGALGIVAYREAVRASGNLSATSAVALLLTFGLGAAAANGLPALAVGAAVVVAVLLDLRPALHRWLRMMAHAELRAGLQMLVISAVVLPLLPDASYGPFGALNPYRLWWSVVLIAGLWLLAHVAIRVVGPSRGALWTGVLGGLASSTVATLTLARRARGQASLRDAALAGAFAASAVMYVRVLVVLAVMATALAQLLLIPFAAAAVTLLVVAIAAWRRREPGGPIDASAEIRVFNLGAALGFGVLLAVIVVLGEASRRWLGVQGLYGVALVSGAGDVDAITISLAQMHGAGLVVERVAGTAIGLAVVANMVAKAVIARVAGDRAFGWRLAGGQALALAIGAAIFLA